MADEHEIVEINETECGLSRKLELAHKWAHRTLDEFELPELARAHELALRVASVLDESDAINGVKLLALIEVLGLGAEDMERRLKAKDKEDAEAEAEEKGTVN
jgi:hypothetical protein